MSMIYQTKFYVLHQDVELQQFLNKLIGWELVY
jgi:hypothetical protein